jgi:hypothetical protein
MAGGKQNLPLTLHPFSVLTTRLVSSREGATFGCTSSAGLTKDYKNPPRDQKNWRSFFCPIQNFYSGKKVDLQFKSFELLKIWYALLLNNKIKRTYQA